MSVPDTYVWEDVWQDRFSRLNGVEQQQKEVTLKSLLWDPVSILVFQDFCLTSG